MEVVRRSWRDSHARRVAETSRYDPLAADRRPITRLSNATLRGQEVFIDAIVLLIALREYLCHLGRLLRVTSACETALHVLAIELHGDAGMAAPQ